MYRSGKIIIPPKTSRHKNVLTKTKQNKKEEKQKTKKKLSVAKL